ncbi:MAG TPA: FecR family protein [Candidatus Polarisedimenticolaceae bacterium]|nr:FecR family protein [Candidatus Polarisedimenticolaceae bacterium]
MTDDDRMAPKGPDDIAALIRIAGRRPGVPEDRTARVKASVREHWLRETSARKSRRRAWAAAALAAAAVMTVALSIEVFRRLWPTPPVDTQITVEAVAGRAWIEEPGRAGPAGRRLPRIDDRMAAGTAVDTEETGHVALRLRESGVLRLDVGTRVRVLGPARVALDRGAVYVDSGSAGEAARSAALTIETPWGEVQDFGTQFEVRLGDRSVRVRVREGKVVLADAGRVHEIPVAKELVYDGESSPTVTGISTYGPEWDWVAQAVKVPDQEGRSAFSFLEWVARERGWRLTFASDELARSAREIVLGGSLERLTLEEALDAVLPTCGMSYRIDEGVLVIMPLAATPVPG